MNEYIRGMYFRRDGTPYSDILEWAADFENKELKRVAETRLWWGGWLSTVWLGLNHNFSFSGAPLIFETMLFMPNSFNEIDMERYSTEAQAIEGHNRMYKKWQFAF